MSKLRQSRTGSYAFFAVVCALVAFLTVGVFTPGYTPTCDHQRMRQGDTCIGTGGGSYDQMVHDHYRDDEIGFVISFPLTILFTALTISEVRRNRRAKKPPRPRP